MIMSLSTGMYDTHLKSWHTSVTQMGKFSTLKGRTFTQGLYVGWYSMAIFLDHYGRLPLYRQETDVCRYLDGTKYYNLRLTSEASSSTECMGSGGGARGDVHRILLPRPWSPLKIQHAPWRNLTKYIKSNKGWSIFVYGFPNLHNMQIRVGGFEKVDCAK